MSKKTENKTVKNNCFEHIDWIKNRCNQLTGIFVLFDALSEPAGIDVRDLRKALAFFEDQFREIYGHVDELSHALREESSTSNLKTKTA